jgi:hypothetical protein
MTDQITGDNRSGVDDETMLLGTTASGVTFAFSAGYVSWLLRGGYLSAAVLSSAPLWREFDPLPILSASGKKPGKKGKADQDTGETDDSTVEDIFEPGAGRGSGPSEAVS